MSLSSSDLKTVMLDAKYLCDSASEALTRLGNSIDSYLLSNTEISFTWVGFDYEGYPDPTTVCDGKINSIDIILTPYMQSNKTNAFIHLSNEIKTGVGKGFYNVTTSGFSTAQQSLQIAPTFTSLSIEINYDKDHNTRDYYFQKLAEQIVDWVKSFKPATPCSGSHGSYTGNATVINFY